MIKKIFIIFFSFFILTHLFAQPTHVITDAEKKIKEAKDLFLKEQYALAFPLFQSLKTDYSNNFKNDDSKGYLYDDINYYYIVCDLKLGHTAAEGEALQYINNVVNQPRVQLMSYQLARYYFKKNNFGNAITYYEKAGLDNFSNDEIADAKFEMAYSYFNLKRFSEAKPLFNEIHQLPDSKYYIPANYYYGFISYYERQFSEALASFKVVEHHKDYQSIVPYYIAEIYYFQGKKEEALRYGQEILNTTNDLYYAQQLQLLIGQIYFENKNFKKALPLLENYVNATKKVDKTVMYELSYCYYENNDLHKAINGFKQLSNERDSMGQNSMYLLGDCYLKTGQKQNARNAFQYCAYNSNNTLQQKISRFNYAKLSYELGFQDIALSEMKKYLADYPGSEYDSEAKDILVDLFANANNFNGALELYTSMDRPTLSMQKTYPKILYGKAVEYINDQQIIKADELLDKILVDTYAGSIANYANFWKGEIAFRLSQYDKAISYLSNFLQSNVSAQGEASPFTAKYDLAYCWLKKNDYDHALQYFEQIVSPLKPNSTAIEQDIYVRTADCYFMKKNYPKAGTMYDDIIKTGSTQSDYALFQKAMIAGIKSSSEKIKLLNNLLRQYPQTNLRLDATMEIANTFMADEKFNEAIPYLKSIVAEPSNALQPQAYLKLGLSYYNANNNKAALENYELLIKKFPASAEVDEALEDIKGIYVEEGKPNDYVALLKKYGKNISVSEADSLIYTTALLQYNKGDCNAARQNFSDYLANYPEGTHTIEANFFKSECYTAIKDWNNALTGYEYIYDKGANPYFERATIAAARIAYFELKDYEKAKKFFQTLVHAATHEDVQLEAVRGLTRCYYQLKDYAQADSIAQRLLAYKNIGTDDKSIAFLVLGKSQQLNDNCPEAINSFKSCAKINKTAWGAEARYEIANCQLKTGDTKLAEKSAVAVIKETPSYDYWVTKSYILLGDIFMLQKDYFNAKATYESVVKNSMMEELKNEAEQKLQAAVNEEKQNLKIND